MPCRVMCLKMCLKNICRKIRAAYKLITTGWYELKHLNTTQQMICSEINRFSEKLEELEFKKKGDGNGL